MIRGFCLLRHPKYEWVVLPHRNNTDDLLILICAVIVISLAKCNCARKMRGIAHKRRRRPPYPEPGDDDAQFARFKAQAGRERSVRKELGAIKGCISWREFRRLEIPGLNEQRHLMLIRL